MGIIVAFWSPWHGRGNTSNCIATAMQFHYKYNASIIITHTQYTRSNMEAAFLTGKENEDLLNFSDLGIDSIERALKTGKLKNEDFISYCNKIDNNLYLLSGSKKSNRELFKNSIGKTIEDICRYSKSANDLTFIDVASGMNDEIAKKVLNLADIVVVTLDQTNVVCEDFFNNQIKFIENKKLLIAMGRYDFESKYSKSYIDKTFSQDVFLFPQLTEYLDSLNTHNVNKFFKTYHYINDEPFFEELNLLVEEIFEISKEFGVEIEKVEGEEIKHKKGILGLFK